MGWLWTSLIVAQVALTVALLPVAIFYAWIGLQAPHRRHRLCQQPVSQRPGGAGSHHRPATPDGEAALRARYRMSQQELERRLEAEPAVGAVTFSMTNPGEELALILELEGRQVPSEQVNYNIVEGSRSGHLVRFNRVAPDFFAAFDVPLVMGRDLLPADAGRRPVGGRRGGEPQRSSTPCLAAPTRSAIASATSGGAAKPTPRTWSSNRWFEIVGVVPDFPTETLEPVGRVYHAAAAGDVYPSVVAMRVASGDPSGLADTLRAVTAAIDPDLQLRDVLTRRQAVEREQGVMRLIGITVLLVMLSVVVLSAAGIYALMSFTVTRRRREIGIRAALGANRNRILLGIFSRALGQLARRGPRHAGRHRPGAAARRRDVPEQGAMLLPFVALFMTVVGLLAALGPARQGLSIQPIEALRDE